MDAAQWCVVIARSHPLSALNRTVLHQAGSRFPRRCYGAQPFRVAQSPHLDDFERSGHEPESAPRSCRCGSISGRRLQVAPLDRIAASAAPVRLVGAPVHRNCSACYSQRRLYPTSHRASNNSLVRATGRPGRSSASPMRALKRPLLALFGHVRPGWPFPLIEAKQTSGERLEHSGRRGNRTKQSRLMTTRPVQRGGISPLVQPARVRARKSAKTPCEIASLMSAIRRW